MESGSRVLTRAWDEYYASIAAARKMIENAARFQNSPDNRAQGYRTILEAEAMAYNFAVAPRLDHPRINVHMSWSPNFYTLGGNGADTVYATLFLDGKRTYRLTGRWGGAKVLLMQRWSHLLGYSAESDARSQNYDFADFEAKDDGSFEVVVSAKGHKGNWIQLDPDSNYNFIFIRRIMADWNDDPGDLNIEVVGEPESDNDLDEQAMAERIHLAAGLVKYLIGLWTVDFYDRTLKGAGGVNALLVIPGEGATGSSLGASPSSLYASMIWDVKADEALIIEMEKPDTTYWSFQLFDVWLRDIDFMDYQTNINMKRAVFDSDNKVRAVLSLHDPGVPNWLDPRGRKQGTFVGRNYRAKTAPVPTVRKVKLSELRDCLPKDTPTITPEQRQEMLNYRRRSVRKLVGW